MNLIDYLTSLTPLWIYFVLVTIATYFIIKRKYYVFDHEQLLKQTPFQIAILAPFISFLYFGFLSWRGHTPQFDSEGMGVFLEISKLPLLILSLTLPLGALTANIHRTFQTKKQIELSEAKNLSDMYYAHNKSYVENFSKVNANREIRSSSNETLNNYIKNINNLSVFIGRPNSLYEMFYPESSPELGPQYEPSRKTLMVIERLLDKSLDSFADLDSQTINQKKITGVTRKDKELTKIKKDLFTLCRYIGLDEYIMYYRFFDTEIENKEIQLKIAIIELFIFCQKLYIVTSEILNIIGITRNTHPELINKCRKLRSCAADIYDSL
ncbi:MAG: hypothetical protein E6009_02685 [Citrobacter freundii]|nr:hypothetical protein [Citrobacter freundii]MDU5712701.1 hypothetical protein [Citrobacter freundii]